MHIFCLNFCLEQIKCILEWREIWWLALPEPLRLLLALCFGSLSIWTVKRCPISFDAFGRIWAKSIFLHTSDFICACIYQCILWPFKNAYISLHPQCYISRSYSGNKCIHVQFLLYFLFDANNTIAKRCILKISHINIVLNRFVTAWW